MAKPKILVTISKALLSFHASKGKNGGVLTRALRAPINEKIEAAQKKLIEDFENDPISQEIAAGPDVRDNPSGTLGGYGGLFSFIGFYRGDTPIKNITDRLSEQIFFRVKSLGFLKFEVVTDFVTKTELFNSTPIPWNEGRSWLDGIEKGISGLGQYMNSSKLLKNSRSGPGIQLQNTLRNGKFQNRAYISKYLNEFEREIKKI